MATRASTCCLDKGKDREDSAEAVDDHEGEGDAQDSTVLVDLEPVLTTDINDVEETR